MIITKSLTGNYATNVQCLQQNLTVVALDFGQSSELYSANAKIARYIEQLDSLENMHVLAQSLVYQLLGRRKNDRHISQKPARQPAKLVELSSAGSQFFGQEHEDGERGDSYETLQKAAALLPPGATIILVAQAYHAARAQKQAELLGLRALLPPGLPRDFSHNDSQRWVRGPWAWRFHEIPSQVALRILKRL